MINTGHIVSKAEGAADALLTIGLLLYRQATEVAQDDSIFGGAVTLDLRGLMAAEPGVALRGAYSMAHEDIGVRLACMGLQASLEQGHVKAEFVPLVEQTLARVKADPRAFADAIHGLAEAVRP